MKPYDGRRTLGNTVMKHSIFSTKLLALIFLTSGLLSACNWVDSTGRQSNNTPTIILDDGSPSDGFTMAINEEATTTIDPSSSSDDDGTIISWSWDKSPIAAGALDSCSDIDGFKSEYAPDSLEEACADTSNCELKVVTEEIDKTEEEIAADELGAQESGSTNEISDKKTIFTINIPKLKAPIGLTYQIQAKDNDGGTGLAEVNFCLIAINEAPEAVNDRFTIIEGEEKIVSGDDPLNLLSNDSDDTDVTNKPLSVSEIPVNEPTLAESFVLGTDGGFTYFYPSDPARPGGEEQFDSFIYTLTDGIHNTEAEVTLRIVSVDDPPLLTSPIPDQIWFAGISQKFPFADHFKDPEGSTLVFSETSGTLPASYSIDELSQGILVGKPGKDEIGKYSIKLAASDGNSITEDDVELEILGNKPPTISTIPEQKGFVGKSFSLDLAGFVKDPENQPLNYSISGQPAYLKLKGSKIQGTPTTSGQSTIKVSANDGFNASVSKSFKFTVVNKAPTVKPIPDQNVNLNKNFNLDASKFFSDPEGQKLTYTLEGSATAYIKIDKNSGKLSGKMAKVGSFRAKVTASDGQHSVSDQFDIRVANPPPVVKSAIPDKTTTAGTSFTFNVAPHFSDPNGDKLTFKAAGLPASGSLKMSSAGVISGSTSASDVKKHSIKVTASDGSGAVSDTFSLTVKASNRPPKLDKSAGNSSVESGTSVSFTSQFSDPDAGDKLTITATDGGSGLKLTSTYGNKGVIRGKAGKTGTFTIKVTATDSSKASVTDSYKLTVTATNKPPTVKSIPDQNIDLNKDFTLNASSFFSDPEGKKLTFSLEGNATTYVKIDKNSGKFSGKMTKAGSFRAKVTASDGKNSVSDQFDIVVTASNRPPKLDKSAGDLSVNVGANVSFTSEFSDPDPDDKLTITATDGGSGLKLTSTSGNKGVVSGIASKAGTFTIKVTAKDTANASVTDTYKLTVTASNQPPVLNSLIPSKVTTTGLPFSYRVSDYFSDPDGDALTYSSNGLPSSNSLKISSAGTISGSPPLSDAGVYQVKVTASDGKASVNDTFELTILANVSNTPPNRAQKAISKTVDIGQKATFVSVFNDPDPVDIALAFSLTKGGASFLSLSSTGQTATVEGTPGAEFSGSTYNIQVIATDDAGQTATDQYTLKVNATE